MTLYVPDVNHMCGSGGCPWWGGMQVGAMEEGRKGSRDETRVCRPAYFHERLWARWRHGTSHVLIVRCKLCRCAWLTDALVVRRAKKAAIKEAERELA